MAVVVFVVKMTSFVVVIIVVKMTAYGCGYCSKNEKPENLDNLED